eukprot:CAMPEP_0198326496 /NCGR_PEP_ID=MMETSP1450-20131203/14011_1 /TAXON_ID=753684 ORGANISM="Madagascaria erythrocladiodes, Strain CCMP3234" /NCGR_SAMPLE_ID=MMETSP1450 /ASSEMBLY_ACC=CAM_ASM_001115 /LENGTH=93 /DNA_ID=CAMNT_0044030461 /DNA_START=25 /DNA_END=303 /DNA_ORIENTATION=-
MTSNVGAEYLIDGATPFLMAKKQVLHLLRQQFRPEFLNRLDEILVFNPLGTNQLRTIVRNMIYNDVTERLAEKRIDLKIEDDAVDLIIEEAYD